ncbi:MAG: hypothetical protein PHT53_05270, partial [Candidatus Omnitrophica bacterium]|nr:hypothetical protein [Candidatus Omnitrophota bacterium]
PDSDLAFTDPTLPPSNLSLPALASPNLPEPKPAMDVSSSYNIPRTPASIDIDASVPTASAQTAVAEAPMISPFAQISEVQRAEPQPLTLTKPESDLAFTDPTLPPSNLSLPALASPNLPEPKPTLETSSSYSIAKTSVPISDINVDISVSPAQARADSSIPAELTQVPEVARMEVPPQPVSFTRPELDMGVLTEPSLSSPALSAPNLSDTPAMAMDTPATLPSRTPAPLSELGVSANAQPDITPAGSKSIPSQAAQTPELPDMGQLADAAKSAIGQLGSAMPSFSMPTTKDIADTFGLTSEGKLDTASPALKAASSMADANVSMPTGWIDTASNAISTSMGKLGELGASLPDVSTAAVGAGGSKSIREEGLNAANRTFADNIEPLNRNINGGTSSTHVDTATGRVYHIAPKELAPVALRNSLAADYVSDDGSPGRLTVSFKEAQEMQRVQNDMQTYRTAGLNNYSALLAALGRNDYGDHGSSWNPGETVGTWKTAYNGYQYNQVLKLNDSGTGVIAVNTNNRYANTSNNGLNYSGYGNSMESYRRSGPLRNFFSRRR